MKILLAFLHIHRRHIWKNKSWTMLGMFYVLLEIQSKMKNLTYHYSTLLLNYKVSLQTGLFYWVFQMLHETFFKIININSISGRNWVSKWLTLATQRVMWIRCRFWKFQKALKHLTSLPSTNYSPLKPKIQNKRISPTVFHEKESLT